MKEREILPGYTEDSKGLKAEIGYHHFLNKIGIWRPVDIVDGNLVIQRVPFRRYFLDHIDVKIK